MVTQKLVEFTQDQLKLGKSSAYIEDVLVKAGWNAQDVKDSVTQAISSASQPMFTNTSPMIDFQDRGFSADTYQPIGNIQQVSSANVVEVPPLNLNNDGFINTLSASEAIAAAEKKKENDKKEKKKKGCIFMALISVVGIFVLLVSGVIGGYYYFVNMPETIIDKALTNVSNAKTANYSILVDSEVKGVSKYTSSFSSDNVSKDDLKFNVELSGHYDINDINNPYFTVNLQSNVAQELDYTTAIRSAFVFSDSSGYLMVDSIPQIQAIPMLSFITFPTEWIKFDLASQKDSIVEYNKKKLTTQQQLELKQKAIETGFITLKKTSSAETVNSVPVYTIEYKVDLSKYELFYGEMAKIVTDIKPLTAEEKKDYSSYISNFSSPISGTIYVGKSDFSIEKLTIDINSKTSEGIESITRLTLSLTNQNKPIDHVVPENTTTWDEFYKKNEDEVTLQMKEMELSFKTGEFDLTTVTGRDFKRIYDIDKIGAAIESYLSKSGNSLKDFGVIESCDTQKTDVVKLSSKLVPTYLLSLPVDSSINTKSDSNTGYAICYKDTDLLVVKSLHLEQAGYSDYMERPVNVLIQ
jgi:hypothetical protein